jgi:thioredoxin
MPRFDTPLNTNDQSIDRVLNAGMPVVLLVLDSALNGSLDESLRQVAQAEAGRMLVAKLHASDNPQTVARLKTGVPALILFKDGREMARTATVTSGSFREYVAYLLGRRPHPADEPTTPPRTETAPGGAAPRKPVVVTDASFESDVLKSDLPVLVDLWAPWCGPCRMIAPVVEKMAGDYAGRLKVAKLNVDENPRTSAMFHVQGIPTLLIFRGGRIVDRIVGAAPEPMLRGRVDAALRG